MSASRRFGLGAALAASGFVAAYAALILTETGQRLENLALRGARQEFEELKAESLAELHQLSMLGFAVAIGLVMLVAFVRLKPRLAFITAMIMGVSVVIAEVAKRLLVRPDLADAPPNWLNNSFPSGHVTVAVAIGIGAIIVAPYALRWLATIGATFYASAISMDVATAGWHRLSGVIGATLLVIAVACIGLFLLARMGRTAEFETRRLVGALVATLVLGTMAVGFGGIGTVLGFGRLLPLPTEPTASDELLAYTSTIVTAVGVVALGFLAVLWLIRPYAIDED